MCAILRGEPVEWPTPNTPAFEQIFFEASAYHGTIPLLYDELKRTSSWQTVPRSLQETLKAHAMRQATLELSRKHETIHVLGTLAAQHIRTLLLKGGSLAHSHYASPNLRARVDTDLLIEKADRRAVLETLEALGYKFPQALSGISSAVRCVKKHHCIDLHWSINNALIFGRAINFDELYRRSTPVPSLTDDARAPGHVDALIIACMHRAAHLTERGLVNGVSCPHGNRLVWLYDIHLLAKGMNPLSWQEFLALTQEKKLSSFCLDAVELAQALFRSPVPRPVMDALNINQQEERIPLRKLQNRTQLFITDFRVLPTWRERLALLKKRLFPSRGYIRGMYRTENNTPLPLLYLKRAVRRIAELVIGR